MKLIVELETPEEISNFLESLTSKKSEPPVEHSAIHTGIFTPYTRVEGKKVCSQNIAFWIVKNNLEFLDNVALSQLLNQRGVKPPESEEWGVRNMQTFRTRYIEPETRKKAVATFY